jgi:hypothetical protein
MAADTLAEPLVLRALNRDYISLLVSADRRPDLYARYGTGNWPAISLLLPDGSPMLSQANPQKVALPITLGAVDVEAMMLNLGEGRKYFDRRQSVLQGISQVYEKRIDLEEAKSGAVDEKSLEPVVRWFLGNVDMKNGGFGVAPKYALPGLMEWALARKDQGRPALVGPARNTLKKLAESPLFDAREGGFHRMAAAPDWGEIQYEKMLASNVELMRELVFAVKDEDDPALRKALADTARFVTTVLARPEGGYYLGQMADAASLDGGKVLDDHRARSHESTAGRQAGLGGDERSRRSRAVASRGVAVGPGPREGRSRRVGSRCRALLRARTRRRAHHRVDARPESVPRHANRSRAGAPGRLRSDRRGALPRRRQGRRDVRSQQHEGGERDLRFEITSRSDGSTVCSICRFAR